MTLVPGSTVPKDTPKSLIWRRKLWEWNTGWMGLGFALAGAFFVTEGLKDLYGKPRPDLLARCDPDLSSINQYIVGGLSRQLNLAPIIVDHRICRNQDLSVLHDGFASFPSGHSSFSFSGLLYLTLFLASKFSISIPYLAPSSGSDQYLSSIFTDYHRHQPRRSSPIPSTPTDKQFSQVIPLRNRAAGPPLPAAVLTFIPIATALFITASRWNDNKHHGFDIISGSLIGIFFAWLGFRWYHLPIRRGAGWSWGARTREHSFWIGVGQGSWVGGDGWESEHGHRHGDIESARGSSSGRPDAVLLGPGKRDADEQHLNGTGGESFELRQVPRN